MGIASNSNVLANLDAHSKLGMSQQFLCTKFKWVCVLIYPHLAVESKNAPNSRGYFWYYYCNYRIIGGIMKINTLLVSFILLNLSFIGRAQQLYNPNDDRFKNLYLEKVQSDYRIQYSDFERQQKMKEKGLISDKEFQEARSRYITSKITYQQAILSLLFEQPHIMIDKAIKFQAENGKMKVRLILRNTTSGIIPGQKLDDIDIDILQTDIISNVYVSIQNDVGVIVSQPYEIKINSLPYDKPITLDFLLLQDIEYITVKSVYGQKSEQLKVLLQKDDSANKVLINSTQFSQEANLGTKVAYEISFALYSRQETLYKLQILNLPKLISYGFLDPVTNSKVSQIKFSQDMTNCKMILEIYLPDQSDSNVVIDRAFEFYVVAIPDQASQEFIGEKQKIYSREELIIGNVGFVKLELIPRGVGSLKVNSINFYSEIKPDESANMPITIINDGTRKLNNIKILVDSPLNWGVKISPELVGSILPGDKKQVDILLTPPSDVSVGDFEATIKIESLTDDERIRSEDKKLRIHIYSSTNVLLTVFLALALIGVLIGILYYGIRLSKK